MISNISIATLNNTIDISSITDTLNINKIFRSDEVDYLQKLADLSIQVDEYMYLDGFTVNAVLVIMDAVDLQKLRNFINNTVISDNIVYFVSNKTNGSFICKPELFSIIGSIYKISLTDYGFGIDRLNVLTIPEYVQNMFFTLDRAGIDFNVI